MSGSDSAFEIQIFVQPEEIDQLGHVNNVAYVRWVQDVAVAHWNASAPQSERERLVWVVLRHEIDYRQAARLGDEILARTWVGSATRLRFDRHTEFTRARDGVVLARARTVLCPMDARSGRPVAVSPEVRAVFSCPDPAQASTPPCRP